MLAFATWEERLPLDSDREMEPKELQTEQKCRTNSAQKRQYSRLRDIKNHLLCINLAVFQADFLDFLFRYFVSIMKMTFS